MMIPRPAADCSRLTPIPQGRSRSRLKPWAAAAVLATGLISSTWAQILGGRALEPARPLSLGLAASATHWQADCGQSWVCDRNDTGYRVTGAWNWSPQGWPQMAVELFYVDEGRVTARAWASPQDPMQYTRLRIDGMGAGVALNWPLDTRWLGTVRVGGVAHRMRWDVNPEAVAGSGLVIVRDRDERFDPALGLGLSYRFTPALSLDGRLDWTASRWRPPAGSLLGSGLTGAHHWSLGLTFGF